MPRAFVFDAYGTLFDVHAAIGRHRAAAGPDADRFSDIWRTKQLEYTWTLTLAGRYVDFWTLTERALDFAFARFASVDKALKPKLLDAYLTLDAFADARAALRELKARGQTTAILSNGSPRMLAAAVDARQDRRRPRCVLSVDAIRIYKPRPEVYALVDRALQARAPPTSCSFRRTAGTSWARRRSASAPPGSIAPSCRRNTGRRRTPCSATSAGSWRWHERLRVRVDGRA